VEVLEHHHDGSHQYWHQQVSEHLVPELHEYPELNQDPLGQAVKEDQVGAGAEDAHEDDAQVVEDDAGDNPVDGDWDLLPGYQVLGAVSGPLAGGITLAPQSAQ